MLQSFFQDAGDIDSLQEAVRGVHPLRRYGTPDDIANLVNWLASDEARYASGQALGDRRRPFRPGPANEVVGA